MIRTLPIKAFCVTGSGGTPSRAKNLEYYSGGTIPWVKSGELVRKNVDSTSEYITELGLKESSAKLLQPGAILIAMYGATVGQVAKLTIPAATNQAVCSIYPDSSVCDLDYFYWYLKSAKNCLLSKRVGGGQPNISQGIIKSLEIPLPPLKEQKRIAKILDAADQLRSIRRKALAQLDVFLQSTFIEMFGDPVTNPKGWEVGIVGDLLESANYGTSKKADLVNGAYPVLRMNNITYSGSWDFKSLKYMDLEEKELAKHLVHKGQILFNRTNSKELVGKTAVYREEKPMAFAGYLVRGVTNELADPEYVGAYMNLPQTKQRLQNMCKNIVGMANINAKEFQKIPIQKPPVELQQNFAKIVEKIEIQKQRMKKQLAELDTLFAALQQRAFNGEL